MAAVTIADLEAEVWRALQTVTDPELDESVTDLKFVTRSMWTRITASTSAFACRPIGAPPISRS